jgi:hypothetical protein
MPRLLAFPEACAMWPSCGAISRVWLPSIAPRRGLELSVPLWLGFWFCFLCLLLATSNLRWLKSAHADSWTISVGLPQWFHRRSRTTEP